MLSNLILITEDNCIKFVNIEMLCNELKPLLGEGWKEKFVHRDLWDPDGYGVASFDLGGERPTVLAMNFETEDIMQYYFDDLPDDEWISLDRFVTGIKGRHPKRNCYINKKYYIINAAGVIKELSKEISFRASYPTITLMLLSVRTHRLIAFMFVPNPDPEKFTIVNHKDLSRDNFSKENLEWCDIKWNSKPENKKSARPTIKYTRLTDGKSFSSKELEAEYKKKGLHSKISNYIKQNKRFDNSYWKIVDTTLEDYLSRHPLQDDWYQHPTMSNVRANGCGVLEVDGVLKTGSRNKSTYNITLNYKNYISHRILLECFLGRELQPTEIVDHILPTTERDINNSKENLRLSTVSENMKNPNTAAKRKKETKIYDFFGNLVDRFDSRKSLVDKYKVEPRALNRLAYLCKYVFDKKNLKYIYYRWKVEGDKKTCVDAAYAFASLFKGSNVPRWKNKYLNTGMPAPDGYYYQQGWNNGKMIYDPDNKDLKRKQKEVFWKNRNKNNNEEGNQ